jgi:ubiquinone/menaquinone biosynthesis C-methylase UbiE
MLLPDKSMLKKTGDVDYYNWNYRFPINLVQIYRFKKIIQLLGSKIYNNLLEIGTGSGIFLPELAKHTKNLFACDIYDNYEHIQKLMNNYQVENYWVEKQDIEQTNYPDNYFDAIVAVSVLEFVSDLHKAIKEIKRILSPDGIFITICPGANKFLDSILSLYTNKKPAKEFGNARLYVAKTLEENMAVLEEGTMLPIFRKSMPVYTHFKLKK